MIFRLIPLLFLSCSLFGAEERWPLNSDEDASLISDIDAPWEDIPMDFCDCSPRHIRMYASDGTRLSEEEMWAPKRKFDYVTRRHGQLMKRDHGIGWHASYGIHDDVIDKVHLVYEGCQARSIEEVRDILVTLVDSYLHVINSYDPPLAQMGHHPFVPEDIKVEIRFDNFFAHYIDRQMVEWVTLDNGIVSYQAYNCNRGDKCFTRRETYQQSQHGSEIAAELAKDTAADDELEKFFREAFSEQPDTEERDKKREKDDPNWRVRQSQG